MLAWGLGLGGLIIKRHRDSLGVVAMFYMFILVVATGTCTFIKRDPTVYLKWMHLITCNLSLNKADLKKKTNLEEWLQAI